MPATHSLLVPTTLSPKALTLATLSLSLMASSAMADLTAQQVWGDWRAYLEGLGYGVTATQAQTAGTLTLTDITVQMNGGPDIETMTLSMGGLQFSERGDGTVEVIMPAVMPIAFDIVPDSTDKPVRAQFTYSQTGQQMIVSGDPAAIAYDYNTDTFALTLDALTVDGTVFGADAARFSLNGGALASKTSVSVGETRGYDQSMQLGTVVYDLFFKNPDGVEAISLNSTLQNMAFVGTSVLPVGQISQTPDLLPLLAAGFAFDGAFTTQGTETKIEVTSPEGTSKIKTGSASSILEVAMGAQGIRYNTQAEKIQMGAQLVGLPFPLFMEMENAGLNIRTPLTKSDVPQDFALGLDLTGFTMSDIIWALFDASGQLPRDPATVALEMSGKATLRLDSLDPGAVEQAIEAGIRPGELNALRIDRLTVDAVGAQVNATGDIAFDNTDTTTLAGFPKPVGDINIGISGANGLMDKLVAMGLLPADQIMGARMMLGLFAVPGDAPDTLKSRIEFNEAGQILANGQRIK